MKMTPRIPPKNASEFSPGNVIRLEFPAQVCFVTMIYNDRFHSFF